MLGVGGWNLNLNNKTLEPVLLTRDGVRNWDKVKLRDGMCGHLEDVTCSVH